MTNAPRRFKERPEFTVEEHLATVQAQRRGDPEPQFETPEYKEARTEALEAAGLDSDEAVGVPRAAGGLPSRRCYSRSPAASRARA